MASLRELAESLGRGEINLRGKPVGIRALKGSESATLSRLYPRPIAPLMADPARGTLAPKILNELDPAHMAAVDQWNRQRWALEACLVTDSVGFAANDEATKKALDESAAWIADHYTEAEIIRIFNESRELSDRSVQSRARDMLIANLADVPAEAIADVPKLPKDFGTTEAFAMLLVCERFGIDPRSLDDTEPGFIAILKAYDRIRRDEERN